MSEKKSQDKSDLMSRVQENLRKIERGEFEDFDAEKYKKMNIKEY